MEKNDSIVDLVWRNIAVYPLETNPGKAHATLTILVRGNNSFF
jgi:hypothetical protein